jgi:glutamate-1-semialdehyde 2,1-aminomutase
MELGGLRTERPRVFLLSTTHGPETAGLAAYLAVQEAYAERNVVGEMERQGRKLADAVNAEVVAAGLEHYVEVTGRPRCLVFLTRDAQGRASQAYRTLFLQEMIRHGVLGQSFVISAAHTDADLGCTVEAAHKALAVYTRAIEAGTVDGLLRGRPVAPALREFAAPRSIVHR